MAKAHGRSRTPVRRRDRVAATATVLEVTAATVVLGLFLVLVVMAFGDSLDRMSANLSEASSDLEAGSARLGRLIEEFEAATGQASDGDLRARIPAEAVDGQFEDVSESFTMVADDTAHVDDSAAEISSATDQQAEVATQTNEGSERLRGATDTVVELAEESDRLVVSLEQFEVNDTNELEGKPTPQPAD